MAEAAKDSKEAKDDIGTADKWFGKLSDWLGEKISAFVAFLFLLFAAGALYGTFIVPRFQQLGALLLAAPIVLAAVAYYNRAAALVLFGGLMLFFIL
ncbi:MAG: hypothetical protein NTW59_01020 [Candidatus Diapherotrites archaeon]|nr:hypothetical protein [Candidatus Diapherotrites archaeon]